MLNSRKRLFIKHNAHIIQGSVRKNWSLLGLTVINLFILGNKKRRVGQCWYSRD